ncbi:hypothetical protein C0L75_02925 [Clostridium perfringens]
MSRIIGCQQLHIAEVTKDDVTGTEFGTVTPVPSLMSIDIQDNKENVTFYSDDQVEQVINSFSGKEVTITLGYLSSEIESKISGNKYEKGVFIQNANATAKEHAIMFRAPLSKGGFQYVCLYKGVLARKETNYKGKEESVEGQTVTLEGVFMPLLSNGDVAIKANTTDDGAQALIKSWFTKVPLIEPSEVSAAQTQSLKK